MYEVRESVWRTPGGHEVRSLIRDGTNDWNTQNAIFADDEYGIPSGQSGVAIDVGAYLGGVSIAYALDNPEARVIAIEPVPPNVELIRQNIALNGLEGRILVIAGAVGTGDVTVPYAYTGSESAEHHAFVGGSTLFDPTEAHETVTYPGLTLTRLVAGNDIAWLKIDTEGAEWTFLDDPAVANIETIVGEWHPYGGHTVGDMASLLGSTHVVTFSGPQAGPGGFRAVRR